MTIQIPDEVLKADISLSAKLIVATAMTYPKASRKEIATKLGVTRCTVFNGIKSAKLGGIVFDTDSIVFDTDGIKSDTPHPVGVCNKGNGVAALPAKKRSSSKAPAAPPTREEVHTYAAGKGRADMADEFYLHYSSESWLHNGEPLTNWRRMFDAWAKRRQKPQPAAARVPTLEEALYEVDKSY